MEKETLIKVENLTVSISKENVLENINFEIKKNDFFTILGPNGAGKSTLLKAIIGLIPYKGKISIKKDTKLSFLPERLSRKKFKELPLTIKDFFNFQKISEQEILHILEEVQIKNPKEFLSKNPGNLSSGEFQRMLIAWSIVKKPDILLFDEPMTGIDIGAKQTIYSLFEKFKKEWDLTIVMITHDLNVVYASSNKVLCLYKKNTCFGKPEEILTPQKLQELYKTPIKFYKHSHPL